MNTRRVFAADLLYLLHCSKCGAQPGEPCRTENLTYNNWVHAARRRKTVTVRHTAKVNTRMVWCPYCEAPPGEPCTSKGGKAGAHHHTARRQRARKALAAVVPASACTSAAMVAGNEKKYSRVIMGGVVKEWVGIGWIEVGPVTMADDLLPRVIEPVIFMPPRAESFKGLT